MSERIERFDDGDLKRWAEKLSLLAQQARQVDGNPPFSDQTLIDVMAGRNVRGWLSFDGEELVAATVLCLSDEPVMEMAVHPAHRRRGLGTRLAKAAYADVNASSARTTIAYAWAHGALPGAVALAKRHHLVPVRELYRMHVQLDAPLTQPELPLGWSIRHFRRGRDEDALLRINAEAFSHHPEQGNLSLADLIARENEPWFHEQGLLLVEQSDLSGAPASIKAFHWTKIDPQAGAEQGTAVGEVYVVGVSPASQGMGLGKIVTIAGINWMLGQGVSEIELYVDSDNTGAVTLYKSLGFTLSSRDVMYKITSKGSAPNE